jgi:MazG family protein
MSPRPLEEPEPTGEPRADALRRLIAIVDRLRDPDGGCPWDLEQTLETIAPHHIEEAHELAEAIESGDDAHMVEEAGDLVMGVVLLARIAEQSGRWNLSDVANAVSEKLVRRHPHVFGDVEIDSSAAAFENWEKIKQAERAGKAQDASAVAGVPVALPALHRAKRMGDKAVSHGFRWSNVEGALAKLREEVDELAHEVERAEVADRPRAELEGELRARVEHELGDVLLAGAYLGCYLGVDPERATREALRRFERRFRAMESDLERPLKEFSLEEMLAAWARAKEETG